MPHHTPLIATIVAGLVGAFFLGSLANRLKLSPLVGYLLAGVLIGPFTPGYVADQHLANELAEIGVILLMFGVGLHFSVKDLLSVRKIAIPGALGQMAVATALGVGLAIWMGWDLAAGVVFGLALSVASTVVLLRALQERRIVQSDRGKIAIGWLIVEDLAMVLALVLLPALGGALTKGDGGGSPMTWIMPLGITLAKVAGFVIFMLVIGRRVVPWALNKVALNGSRELFRLAVLAIALGIAFGAAMLFGVSFALGAFFAGMILAESELSHRAAEETLPLRDAFAVLFFVSVGMLFNPMVIINNPLPVLAVLAIIIIGKSAAALAIIRLFKHNRLTALTVAASLAQIGEFSFILAGLGVELKMLPPEGRDLILAGAILSIVLNPFVFGLALKWAEKGKAAEKLAADTPDVTDLIPTSQTGHTVLVGLGRVGKAVAEGLTASAKTFVAVDDQPPRGVAGRERGYEVMTGNAAEPGILEAAGVATARRLLVAVPDGFEAGQILERARAINPDIQIIARAHSDEEVKHLISHGAGQVILGELEIARRMLESTGASPPLPMTEPHTPAPVGVSNERHILDDAESVLMKGLADRRVWPGESIAHEDLTASEEAEFFGAARLAKAFDTLKAKGLIIDLGDGRLTVTREGFVAASQI